MGGDDGGASSVGRRAGGMGRPGEPGLRATAPGGQASPEVRRGTPRHPGRAGRQLHRPRRWPSCATAFACSRPRRSVRLCFSTSTPSPRRGSRRAPSDLPMVIDHLAKPRIKEPSPTTGSLTFKAAARCEHLLQALRARHRGGLGPVDRRRSEALHLGRPRSVRPQPLDVRLRLARLRAGGQLYRGPWRTARGHQRATSRSEHRDLQRNSRGSTGSGNEDAIIRSRRSPKTAPGPRAAADAPPSRRPSRGKTNVGQSLTPNERPAAGRARPRP